MLTLAFLDLLVYKSFEQYVRCLKELNKIYFTFFVIIINLSRLHFIFVVHSCTWTTDHSSPTSALFWWTEPPPPSSSSCTLYPAVHFSFSRSLFQTIVRPLPLQPCGIHWSACSAMLSLQQCTFVCPSQVHFLNRIWFSTGSCSVFSHTFSYIALISWIIGTCTHMLVPHLLWNELAVACHSWYIHRDWLTSTPTCQHWSEILRDFSFFVIYWHNASIRKFIYPLLKILLFRLLLFCEWPLVVEKLVRFLTQVVNGVHQKSKILLQEWAAISHTDKTEKNV